MTYTKCSQFTGAQPAVERSLDLVSALNMSGLEDVWGEIHLSTNGESHMDFTLRLKYQKAMDNRLSDRYYSNHNHQPLISFLISYSCI